MDRRKFFKKLGLTAAVAAIAPRLLAEETPVEKPYTMWFDLGPGGEWVEGDAMIESNPTEAYLKEWFDLGVAGSAILTYYSGDKTYRFPYMSAYKKPLTIEGVTIIFLPKELSWGTDFIILRDSINNYTNTIELKRGQDLVVYRLENPLELETFGLAGPVQNEIQVVKDGKWIK